MIYLLGGLLDINKFTDLSYKHIVMYVFIVICFVTSILFVYHNYSFYDHTIARVTETHLEETTEVDDMYENKDYLFTQSLIAEIKNGEQKGQQIHLTNQYSISKAYDQKYDVGDELFISIDTTNKMNKELTGVIKDVKRDKYVLLVAWIFIFTLLIVGKKQGLFSIISLVVNAILLSFALDIYLHTLNVSLLFICSVSIILFTVISLLLSNGFHEKTYAAIISTLIGTSTSLLITYLVMMLTSEKGLRYEEMQFITVPYQMVFMSGLFIGALGAVMDVSITMSSSIFGLYEKNNDITVQALKDSGLEIGKDIMGTMTNILFFAYISGSIPMLILYLKNASPLGFTLSLNLSLELARALAGGIGIVLTIPIGLYTTIFFINRKRTTK
jgi:uncharacterized membrane protein